MSLEGERRLGLSCLVPSFATEREEGFAVISGLKGKGTLEPKKQGSVSDRYVSDGFGMR